jgi:hypothetical protein
MCRSVASLLAVAVLMAAHPQVAPPSGPSEPKKSELAFLNLESLASVVRNAVDRTRQRTPADSHAKAPPTAQTERQQYVALYRALTKLQRTRASYNAALRLYVAGVKNHLPPSKQNERHDALVDQVRELRTNLDSLTAAFDPLKLSLDYHAPEVSALIDEFVGGKQARVASLGVVDTLTLPELDQLQSQATSNGKTLDSGIKKLLIFITGKYPDIDKAA